MDAQDWADHYDNLHDTIGVEATLTPITSGEAFTITVIDKSAGAEVSEGVSVYTVRPAADVRRKELDDNALTREDLNGATLVMNGRTYKVETHQLRPSPVGESPGEVRLVLIEQENA